MAASIALWSMVVFGSLASLCFAVSAVCWIVESMKRQRDEPDLRRRLATAEASLQGALQREKESEVDWGLLAEAILLTGDNGQDTGPVNQKRREFVRQCRKAQPELNELAYLNASGLLTEAAEFAVASRLVATDPSLLLDLDHFEHTLRTQVSEMKRVEAEAEERRALRRAIQEQIVAAAEGSGEDWSEVAIDPLVATAWQCRVNGSEYRIEFGERYELKEEFVNQAPTTKGWEFLSSYTDASYLGAGGGVYEISVYKKSLPKVAVVSST